MCVCVCVCVCMCVTFVFVCVFVCMCDGYEEGGRVERHEWTAEGGEEAKAQHFTMDFYHRVE